jgi:hypothetical protein
MFGSGKNLSKYSVRNAVVVAFTEFLPIMRFLLTAGEDIYVIFALCRPTILGYTPTFNFSG